MVGLLNMRSLEKFTNDVLYASELDELPITPRPGESGPEPKRRKTNRTQNLRRRVANG